MAALGLILQPGPAATAAGGVLNVTARVVDACSITSPAAGPRPPRGRPAVPPGLEHRCAGPAPPHRVTLRPAPPEPARAAAPAEHGPGRTTVQRTREAGREVVIVTVTY